MLPFGHNNNLEPSHEVHEFYMNILNALPNIIYWVDESANLKGCNAAFIQALGLEALHQVEGSPYQQMSQFGKWQDDRVAQFRLNDMEVLFSGKGHYLQDEQPVRDQEGRLLYYKATRIPQFNSSKKVVGLIVILTDVTATVALKAAKPSKIETTTPSEKLLVNGHLPNVLMIEDNLIAQNVEKAILTSLNCQVDVAPSLDNALKLFNPGKYDLVLMDINLEDTSGYVVAKKLRQIEANTQYHVPIVALTGYEADKVISDCKYYTMEGAITKPLTCEQAAQLIQHYIFHQDIPVQGLKNA